MSDAPPSILFVHDQYPGQFGAFAQHLTDQGWTVSFATLDENLPVRAPYQMFGYTPHRSPSAQTHPYAQSYDRAALTGQACARSCMNAKEVGALSPDIIVSHAGPGAGLFLRDLFPDAYVVAYCEWWYKSPGVDTSFLATLTSEKNDHTLDELILARSRNMAISAELLAADHALCPTKFQSDQFPEALRQKITVSHDGIDVDYFTPLPVTEELKQPDHLDLAQLPSHAPVVTYATRGIERHRGFPEVFKAFSEIAAIRKDVYFVIAGENQVFYGSDEDRKIDWLARSKSRYPIPADRLICSGTLTKSDYRWLLRRSCAHIYATVPFVLSWSLLEAMATGAPLIVSDVAPVREVVPEHAAIFADLRVDGSLQVAINRALMEPENIRRRSEAAREKVLADFSLSSLFNARTRWLMEGLRSKATMNERYR